MPLLLPEPAVQFCDANGHPFAGGTIDTYIPGTDTPKDTWQDRDGTVLNTNPIVLDSAGRALIWGTGEYRFVLKDAAGNLIYDQVTSVVDLSGFVTSTELTDAVQAETDRATAAEAAEVTRAEAAEANLQSQITAEVARAEAEEAHLQSEIDALSGGGGAAPTILHGVGGPTNGSGHAAVTFSTAFATTPAVVATIIGAGTPNVGSLEIGSITTSGFDVWVGYPAAGATINPGISISFCWLAVA